MQKRTLIAIPVVLIIGVFIFSRFFTLFLIPPIPFVTTEGATLVVSRMDEMNFIDSAQGICRRAGQDNGFCHIAVLDRAGKEMTVHSELPFSRLLFNISN